MLQSSEDEAVSEKEVSNSEEDVTDSSENESHNKSSGMLSAELPSYISCYQLLAESWYR